MTLARDFRARPLDVLVVDDDRTFSESLAHFLGSDERITVGDIACDLESALVSTGQHTFDLALVDVRLDASDGGYAVIEALRMLHPDITTVMMSGLDKSDIETQALSCGACAVIVKTELTRGGHDAVLGAYLMA